MTARTALVPVLMGAAALAAAPAASGAVRQYWVAATPVTWNAVPNGRDAIMGTQYDPANTVFPTTVYRRYTRGWGKPVRNTPARGGNQNLIPGPLLRARVGDRVLVHFKNLDHRFDRAHSMHFHGVHYKPSSDGAYLPGFSGRDADVKPGRTWTYRLRAGRDSAGVWPYHDHGPSIVWNCPIGANTTTNSRSGDLVQWDVIGIGSEHHTFHVHGHRWMAADGTPRDTQTVGPAESLKVRWREEDPGTWLSHCHVESHMMAGMIGTSQVKR
ncbi:MAG: hypothetical protein QOF33_1749 [Thermomicrobiales bacterium]|nr:hypothetical protein [Thermomicrobiales bacterium]